MTDDNTNEFIEYCDYCGEIVERIARHLKFQDSKHERRA